MAERPTKGRPIASHDTVHHAAKEFAHDDVTTNTIFKRGMVGIYQHCGEQHLQRYLDEFTFRWNNRGSPVSRIRIVLASQPTA